MTFEALEQKHCLHMTHFRFRHKRVGYMRWRCRTSQRRTFLVALPLLVSTHHAPSTAAWRRSAPALEVLSRPVAVLKIGDFIVSEEGDPQITGHPDIRY
jgi:hypothetical protein